MRRHSFLFRFVFFFLLSIVSAANVSAEETSNPPEPNRWSEPQLQEAKEYSKSLDTAAVIILHKGNVVDQWGDVALPLKCHSTRKSILSALYGRFVEDGTINLDATLGQMGIDDNEPSLTSEEKRATVRDLLMARSGIYHPALYETKSMAAKRPGRGSHPPGTFWYYNNWDFNAAGSIFENLTGRSLFEEFEERFAIPLNMQDFRRERDTQYVTGKDSVHPAYPFRLSARDMAKFGQLMLQNGRWEEQQLVPESWVKESTRVHSLTGGSAGGYAYMWWVGVDGKHFPGVTLPPGSFSARGYRGQYLVIIPEWEIVICHRVNSFKKDTTVSRTDFSKLLGKILAARPPEKHDAKSPGAQRSTSQGRLSAPEQSTNSLHAIQGTYWLMDSTFVQVRSENEGWSLQIGDSKPEPMKSIRPGVWEIPELDVELRCNFDSSPCELRLTRFDETITLTSEAKNLEEEFRTTTIPEIIDRLTPRLMFFDNVPGVSVALIQKNELVWLGQYGIKKVGQPDRVDAETVFEAASMSKPVFAYVALQLVEKGILDLDTPLVKYLEKPYTESPLHRQITARMVLSHTSGFPNWRPGGRRKGGPIPVHFKPGTKYQYSGEGIFYLQKVVEKLTRHEEKLDRLMSKNLLQPLHMQHSSYVWQPNYDLTAASGHDRQGALKQTQRSIYRNANAAFTLYTNPFDYSKFLLEMMNEDRSSAHSLNKKQLKEMMTIQSDVPETSPLKRRSGSGAGSVHYGLGWKIEKVDSGLRYLHTGSNSTGFRCRSEFHPRTGNGIIIMTNGEGGKELCTKLIRYAGEE